MNPKQQLTTKVVTLKRAKVESKGHRQVKAAVAKHGYNALYEMFKNLAIETMNKGFK